MLPRYKIYHPGAGLPYPTIPFVLDFKLFDTYDTIKAALRNVPEYCVAISICWDVGRETREMAEKAMDARDIRIIWWRKGVLASEITGV